MLRPPQRMTTSLGPVWVLRKAKQASARLKDMWVAWVIIESVLWLINLCVGIYSVYKVQQNRREGRPTAFPLTQNPGPGRA